MRVSLIGDSCLRLDQAIARSDDYLFHCLEDARILGQMDILMVVPIRAVRRRASSSSCGPSIHVLRTCLARFQLHSLYAGFPTGAAACIKWLWAYACWCGK
jgi:hypothetical protein